MSKKERQKKKIAEKQQAVSVTGKKEKNAGINWGVVNAFFSCL